ncbi:hypothetical protein HLK66_05895 [Niallia circulans]|uniref:hypothetical protein n=1 Tax=Niallia circulans TaxID=1397 RepID=UPI0014908102|nr:hypothetical protein [Niallia circulans]QJX61229.1 hypothetical protein HLK66_05895 [Niallia circulans]
MNNNPIYNLEDLIKKEYSNIACIIVKKDGSLVYEKYFDGYTKECLWHHKNVGYGIKFVQ